MALGTGSPFDLRGIPQKTVALFVDHSRFGGRRNRANPVPGWIYTPGISEA